MLKDVRINKNNASHGKENKILNRNGRMEGLDALANRQTDRQQTDR